MTQKTPSLALDIQAAQKNFKDLQALKSIDLQVKSGEFFGLLGPNGAGKSTLIKSIVGLNRLTSGQIKVFGHDVRKEYRQAKNLIGYSPQEVNLERYFSIENTIAFQAGYFGVRRQEQKQRVKDLLSQFDLTEKAKVPFLKLSGGMQKRALIAKALVSHPKLLILDEPTAGVDVEQRHELWKFLRKLNADGTTIILTTHYIDEAEALCERIGIINHGEIKELGSPKQLIKKYCVPKVQIKTNSTPSVKIFSKLKHLNIKQEQNTICATGDSAGAMTQSILTTLSEDPELSIEDIAIQPGNLEDVFIHLTGQSISEINDKTKTH